MGLVARKPLLRPRRKWTSKEEKITRPPLQRKRGKTTATRKLINKHVRKKDGERTAAAASHESLTHFYRHVKAKLSASRREGNKKFSHLMDNKRSFYDVLH